MADHLFCRVCNRGPLLGSERTSDNRCVNCAQAIPLIFTREEVETALRQFVCSARPELATGYVIDLRNVFSNAPIAIAFKPEK